MLATALFFFVPLSNRLIWLKKRWMAVNVRSTQYWQFSGRRPITPGSSTFKSATEIQHWQKHPSRRSNDEAVSLFSSFHRSVRTTKNINNNPNATTVTMMRMKRGPRKKQANASTMRHIEQQKSHDGMHQVFPRRPRQSTLEESALSSKNYRLAKELVSQCVALGLMIWLYEYSRQQFDSYFCYFSFRMNCGFEIVKNAKITLDWLWKM